MKKLALVVVSAFLLLMMPQASAANTVIRITGPIHQTFTGEFRNDDLAQSLTPSGDLGLKVFQPIAKNRTWVIDAALIDEVILMSGEYTLATEAEPAGKEIATAWLTQLKRVTTGNDVVALAYGNPDIALAKRLAPSELKNYFVYGQDRLQLALGRIVRSEPEVQWSVGKSGLSNPLRKNYSDNRKALTRLSRVVDTPELIQLRARLAQLLSPTLDKDSRDYFSYSATEAVDAMVHKLRINSGKYQITTSSVKLPVTVINEFAVDVTVDIAMLPINSRVVVDSFDDVVIPANSKRQLEMQVDVIAPGQTTVSALITDSDDDTEVVPEALLTLNSTVIDSKVTWFTTGAAILLLLAAVAQSVRRVRRRGK
ncbi:hypothetical protein MCEMKE26_01358 [Candidatus Nanopelagicaceae bacterium]